MPYFGNNPSPLLLNTVAQNGKEMTLDADADTSITADTDDQIDIKIGGADDFQFTANTFTAQSGSTIAAQALTATTITASGIVKTDDATEATSTTDGSLQTDGGLSVVKDAVFGDDVKLLSDSAVLSFGADSEITLTHSADSGLLLKHANTADDSFPTLTLQTGDTDIASGDVLGRIAFQAPDEGAGTDAILVPVNIEAVSQGDFSSSNNATSLIINTSTTSEAGTAGDGGKFSFVGNGEFIIKSLAQPDGNYPVLSFQTGETDIQANDIIGFLSFSAPDEATGSDANLICGAIACVSTGDFSSSANTTQLEFRTSISETATTKMLVSPAGAIRTYPSSGGNHIFNDDGIDADFTVESANDSAMLHVDAGTDRVGIGTSSPGSTLHVYQNAEYGNYAADIQHDGNSSNYYGLNVRTGTDDGSGTNYAITVARGDNSAQGFITFSGGTVTYGAFTAHHEISLPDVDKSNDYDYGTLLEIDKIYYTKNNDGTDQERGIRYLVKKSQSAYSRKVLGAYSGDMLAVADKDILYTEDDTIPDGKKVGDVKTDGGTYKDNLHQASVLGDGHIICNGEKGNISVGDGITTSSTAGVGMKADKLCMIVGIAQEDVTFSSTSETKLIPVQYGVRQFTPWTD